MIAAPNPSLLRQLGAFAAVGLIFAGLALKGADGAALAAMFGAALVALLALEILTFPGARLVEAARRNWITIAAAGLFCLWSLAAAWPMDAADAPGWWRALWHPLWAEFGAQRGAISLSPYRTLEGVAAFAGPAAAYALGVLNTADRQDRDRAGRLLTAAAVAIALLSLVLHINGVQAQPNRLSGGFNSPNSAATLFGALTLLMTALVVRAARGRLSGARPARAPAGAQWVAFVYAAPVTLAGLALTIACMFLTGSRAGLLSLAGAFLLFYALIQPPPRALARWGPRANAAIWAIAAIGGFLLLAGGDFLLSRLVSLDIDAEGRRLMIETHWRAFLDRPLLGHGLNTFHEINLHYTNMQNWEALHIIGAAHNIFVQTLEENGVLGAVLFAAMLGPPLWRAIRIVRARSSGAEWAAAALAAVAFAFAHGLVDFGLQVPATAATLAYALGAFAGGAESGGTETLPATASQRAPTRA